MAKLNDKDLYSSIIKKVIAKRKNILLIIGMLFFNVGVEISMTPIGERTGTVITKSKNIFIVF